MPTVPFWSFVLLLSVGENFALSIREEPSISWTGKWFPTEPSFRPEIKKDEHSRVAMGLSNPKCDDGKVNITLDWDNSFEDYTCTNPRSRFVPNPKTEALLEFENIPKAYVAPHFCMDTAINYPTNLPSYGPHRPLWPIFGEYKYLPKQRWLHALEHGAIVAVYHPCADLREIKLLKKLVRGCLRKHIITPSRDLTEERPLGLLSWGARYTFSTVYPNAVIQFIKERALKGYEDLPDDGQFDYNLIQKSSIVSDFKDSRLCPDL